MPPQSDEESALPALRLGPSPEGWTVRPRLRAYLTSKPKHYAIVGLVALDATTILAELLVSVLACERGLDAEHTPWVAAAQQAAKVLGLVISALFLAELAATVWAFGPRWLWASWFHALDALVIVGSFVVDVLAHGALEEVASLVIVLRLWRLVKMVEEVGVGASDAMEELTRRVEVLQREKEELLARLEEGGQIGEDGRDER